MTRDLDIKHQSPMIFILFMAIVDEGAKHALILGGDSYQTFIDTMSQWLQRHFLRMKPVFGFYECPLVHLQRERE